MDAGMRGGNRRRSRSDLGSDTHAVGFVGCEIDARLASDAQQPPLRMRTVDGGSVATFDAAAPLLSSAIVDGATSSS